jgi:quinol monooxygenase YgiN
MTAGEDGAASTARAKRGARRRPKKSALAGSGALADGLVERHEKGTNEEVPMVRVGLWVKLEAKPGKESAVAEFLTGGLALAQQEPDTTVWFALRLGPSTFGIFDAFPSDAGRKAHLNGPIAAALMAKAGDLLAKPPSIEQVDVLAAKVPG